MIILPNLNLINERPAADRSLMDQRAKQALELIQENGGPVSRVKLEEVWEIGRSTATLWLEQLVGAGVLVRVGHGRNTKYTRAV